jgi:hypothetical protein
VAGLLVPSLRGEELALDKIACLLWWKDIALCAGPSNAVTRGLDAMNNRSDWCEVEFPAATAFGETEDEIAATATRDDESGPFAGSGSLAGAAGIGVE